MSISCRKLRLSVCPSQSEIVSKWTNLLSKFFHRVKTLTAYFSESNQHYKIPMGLPITGDLYTGTRQVQRY